MTISSASAIMPTYARADVAFSHGEGAYLFSEDGRRFLDFTSGIATASLGHAHPHLVETLKAQAEKLWHVSNLFMIPDGERLAQRLCDASFADQVFFCNSGAEANEGAIKVARKFHSAHGNPQKTRVICCTNAFHGRTIATMAATGGTRIGAGFGPAADGFDHVPFGNLNALRDAITDETAAILVEPVQGEGGILPAGDDFLRGLRAAADEFGILLIYDEIQCGMGRSGRLFQHQWSGVTPDIQSVAKGIGGGFPFGAVLATAEAAKGMTAGSHGSTYGGNPLAMAVGNAVLDVMLAPGFLDGVAAQAAALRAMLDGLKARYPALITDVRGKGLLLGMEMAEPIVNTDVVAKARDNGLLLVPAAQNVVRTLPPLTIGADEIAEAENLLTTTLDQMSA